MTAINCADDGRKKKLYDVFSDRIMLNVSILFTSHQYSQIELIV